MEQLAYDLHMLACSQYIDYAREIIYYFLSGEVSIWIKSFNELNVFPQWTLQDL